MKKVLLVFFSFLIALGFLAGCGNNSNNYYKDNYRYLEGEEVRITKLDYQKVMEVIKSGDAIIYFGGAWCPNCQAAISYINEAAIKHNVTVYNFDTRINGTKATDDIRNCINDEAKKMYADLIRELGYVNPSNIVVKTVKEIKDGKVTFTDEVALDEFGKEIPRMAVPTVVVIKNGKLLGAVSEEYVWDEALDMDHQEFASGYRQLLDDLFKLA